MKAINHSISFKCSHSRMLEQWK